MVFSEEVNSWIVKYYSSDKGLTQLQVFALLTKRLFLFKRVIPKPGICSRWKNQQQTSNPGWSTSQTILILKSLKPKSLEEFKVIVKGISRDTLLRVADNFWTIAKLCIQEEGGHFEYLFKKKKWTNQN